MIRSSRTISNAKPCSTFGNLPLIRSYTIATVVVCNTLCASGWRFSAGRRLRSSMTSLGISAAGSATRAGFERMVAEVCLGKVGAVAAREVSHFARNSRDWQQLIEMCGVVDTLLVDEEAIYAPRQGNDRLLLGLKGSLNEYELDLLGGSARLRHANRKRDEAN